jgi:UDP-glucuronate 4-epimerase
MKILITGYAGFIGHALSLKLLSEGLPVVGIDNLNDYYNPRLKNLRHNNLLAYANNMGSDFSFHHKNINDKVFVNRLFSKSKIDTVIHLAAQAGVRHSITHPLDYFNNNIFGFFNIIDAAKNHGVERILYASTSGVYGASTEQVMKESDNTDQPIQFYAATKKCNEIIAHSYSSMYGISSVGLRFFTVYGPWGRPDMAIFKFTEAIKNGKNIDLFNYGNHFRSFTYISDLVNMIFHIVNNKDIGEMQKFEIFNIGNPESVPLPRIVDLISNVLSKKATSNQLALQPGDVVKTAASIDKFKENIFNYKEFTDISLGIENFVRWYLKYEDQL